MNEQSELDRFLNLPAVALERMWSILDDEKDQNLKFVLALALAQEYVWTEEDNDLSEDEDHLRSYNTNVFNTFVNPDTAYKRIKLTEDIASWILRSTYNPDYEPTNLFQDKPELLEEWLVYIRDCTVLAQRYEEQLLKIIPGHDPLQCDDCSALTEKALEELDFVRVTRHFVLDEIWRNRPDSDDDDEEDHFGRGRFDSDSEDEFDKILWCCPKWLDSFAVAILKLFREKIRLTDSFDTREEFHEHFDRAVRILDEREWSGVYGGKAFRIYPGEGVVSRTSFVKKIKKQLQIFEPWERSLEHKIAKKKVSKMSWVEKTVKPKKIVFKPWSEKETEMFDQIEATRLPKEEIFNRREHFPILTLMLKSHIEAKQVTLSMKGLIKDHPHTEKPRRRRTKSCRY